MKKSIGCIIPVFNSEKHLEKIIPVLKKSPLNPKILVIDSSSFDNSVKKAEQLGAETYIIPQSEFNHGSTRNLGRQIINTDIVLFFTPDAYPVSSDIVEILSEPIIKGETSITYGRQIPRKNASIFESFPREFNYPDENSIRSIKDFKNLGVYTFFNSDSCAAYDNKFLDELGGFPRCLVSEDYFAAVKILNSGGKIAYLKDAAVIHSHKYSIIQEFQRYFDTGYSRKEMEQKEEIYLKYRGKESERGKLFFKELMKRLYLEKPLYIPYGIFHTFIKWLGFKIGYNSFKLPLFLKKAFSMQKYYWKK